MLMKKNEKKISIYTSIKNKYIRQRQFVINKL